MKKFFSNEDRVFQTVLLPNTPPLSKIKPLKTPPHLNISTDHSHTLPIKHRASGDRPRSITIKIGINRDENSHETLSKVLNDIHRSVSKSTYFKDFTLFIGDRPYHSSFRKEMKVLFTTLLKWPKKIHVKNMKIILLEDFFRTTFYPYMSRFILHFQRIENLSFEIPDKVALYDICKFLETLESHPMKNVSLPVPRLILSTDHIEKRRLLYAFRGLECRSLDLKLNFNLTFNQSELTGITESFTKLRTLRSLALQLGGNFSWRLPEPADVEHMNFFNSLKNLSLKRLAIDLTSCRRVSEENILAFLQRFFDPTNYEVLSFKFDKFAKMSSYQLINYLKTDLALDNKVTINTWSSSEHSFDISYSKKKKAGSQNQFTREITCNLALVRADQDQLIQISQAPQINGLDFFFAERTFRWRLCKPTLLTRDPYFDDRNLLFLSLSFITKLRANVPALLDLLEKYSHVEGVVLDFDTDSSKHVEEYYLQIISQLFKFGNLRALAINWPECQALTDPVFAELSQCLVDKQALRTFILNVDSCENITDKAMIDISSVLKSSGSLGNLHLSMKKCGLITGEFLRQLAESVQKLENLENLSLEFPGLSKISNEDLNNLIKTIENHPRLINVKLDFSYSNISNQNFLTFDPAPLGSKGLRRLEMRFDNCVQLEDEAIVSIGSFVSRLKTLQGLKISLRGNDNFTEDSQMQLISEILQANLLRHFTFDFGNIEEPFQFLDLFLEFEQPGRVPLNFRAPDEIWANRIQAFSERFGGIRKFTAVCK